MRIISDFKDYYDSLAEYEKGDYKTRMYIRNEKELKVIAGELGSLAYRNYTKHVTNGDRHVFLRLQYIIFCGKVYPFIEARADANSWNTFTTSMYYTIDSLLNEFPGIKKDIKRKYFFESSLSELMENPLPDLTELCVKHNTPVILYDPSNNYKSTAAINNNLVEITINPNLSKLEFYKHLSHFEAYQALDNFVNNVLVSDKMPEYPRTDVEKLESHGFDKKTSFRKPKSKMV